MTTSSPTFTRTDGPTTRTDGPTYAKIIGNNFGSYPYRVGLNTLAHNGELFDPRPECGPGGLYYCEIKDILEWQGYGKTLCIVEPVGQIVPVGNKFKTDRLEIVSMMELAHVATWKFLFGMNLYVDDEKVWIWAARSGHLEVVKFLDESSTVSYLVSAFPHAVQRGCLEIVKFLVTDRGVDVNVSNGNAFQSAAINGHLEVMKFLVEHSVDDLYKKNVLLRLAAANGHLEVVKFLVDQGADVNAKGEHILGLAAQNGHLEVVKFLVDQGANVHATDEDALQWAAKNDHLEVVKFLVDRGADLHARGEGALGLAAANGNIEVVKFLVDQGADINAGNDYAMRRAVANCHSEVIKFLAKITVQVEPADTWLSRAMEYISSLW